MLNKPFAEFKRKGDETEIEKTHFITLPEKIPSEPMCLFATVNFQFCGVVCVHVYACVYDVRVCMPLWLERIIKNWRRKPTRVQNGLFPPAWIFSSYLFICLSFLCDSEALDARYREWKWNILVVTNQIYLN